MSKRVHDIYASAPMQGLLADEMAALMPVLQRCAGTRGLLLSAAPADQPPALPLLGHWTGLGLADGRLVGDVRASALEPLPFSDDAFDLILLRHVLETAPQPAALLRETVRCLAPGGVLVLAGVHPLGAWSPWWHWRMRHRAGHLNSPMQLGHWLRRVDLQVEQSLRVGRAWPGPAPVVAPGAQPFGGGYLLVARKRRAMSLPVRLRPHSLATRPRPALAPEARRSSAA
jgi:SAM-dependent methyltransferase